MTYRGDHITVEDARLFSNAGDPAADRRRGQRHELAPRLAKAAG